MFLSRRSVFYIAVVASTGACTQRLMEIQNSQLHGTPLLGQHAPTCDADGSYAAVQCLGST